MTIKELKDQYGSQVADISIYQGEYGKDSLEDGNVQLVGNYDENVEATHWEIMNEERYHETVESWQTTDEQTDFAELYDDADAKILCIVVVTPFFYGGKRKGAGRPVSERKSQVTIMLTPENKAILDTKPERSKYINDLISRDNLGK